MTNDLHNEGYGCRALVTSQWPVVNEVVTVESLKQVSHYCLQKKQLVVMNMVEDKKEE